MAKLILLVATFALFLLLANASIYRTTVVIDEEENPRSESCQQQFQQAQQLRHCQMYLGQQRGQYYWDNQQQHLRECCRQLQQMDTRCRCQGLEQALRGQQEQGQYGGGQGMYETASRIPRMCNIQPSRGCDFSRSRYDSV